MTGRVNGCYKWRLGWRSDVLRIRDGYVPQPPKLLEIDESISKQIDILKSKYIVNEQIIEDSWLWWRNQCGSPRFVLAPMIGQSDICFRVLCRRYGVSLCYTPMYLAKNILSGMHEEEIMKNTEFESDNLLIIQLAGNSTTEMIEAARKIQPYASAIDINFGCPQKCAELGQYGSFYLENNLEGACAMIGDMKNSTEVPITVKMRIQSGGLLHTIEVALRLQQAGVSALAIHGRERTQRDHEGPADWFVIKALKYALQIPVIANGSMQCYEDTQKCFEYTNADAVMCGTGLLRQPTMCMSTSFLSVLCENYSCSLNHDKYDINRIFIQYDTVSVLCLRRYLALHSCYEYVSIVKQFLKLYGFMHSTNGKSWQDVTRDHLRAMLQYDLMFIHMQLWSLLSSKSVNSIAQFEAIVSLAHVTLLEELNRLQCNSSNDHVINTTSSSETNVPLGNDCNVCLIRFRKRLRDEDSGGFSIIPLPIKTYTLKEIKMKDFRTK